MIKIGTRKSPLAMRQAEEVLEKLKQSFPDEEFEIVGISTKGDKQADTPLKSFGGKGVFIKELETALLNDEIQLAVHSAKDMPTELPDGLVIGAALERGAHEDVLITLRDTKTISSIGTGSARREIQVRELYPNAQVKSIRGNIHTRIEKLKNGGYDAIVMAKAAIDRLQISDPDLKITTLDFVCAAGQGIIAVETNSCNTRLTDAINDADTFTALLAEREFLRLSGGGCHSPVGAKAEVKNGVITMKTLLEKNGKIIRKIADGTDPIMLARKMARED